MTSKTKKSLPRIKSGIRQGLIKGWKGLIWLLKIILPISFATALLVHFGIIYKLDFLLTPVMTWLSLPASAALVIIIGLFTGIYGTVAALSVMPFSVEHMTLIAIFTLISHKEHMTLIAIFTLISHNIIQESIVQGNSGLNSAFAAFFRLFMSLLVTFVCAKIMGVTPETGGVIGTGAFPQETKSFIIMLKLWGGGTFKLIIQIFCIIMPLMVILEIAKEFNIITFITKITSPIFSVMGLSRSTGMLWLTASIFGLAYGAAVIVEETQSNEYEKEDLIKLHLSIGINHSMIEDPALFLPLGLPIFWLWIPRLLAAIIVTWLYSVFLSARRRYVKRACHFAIIDDIRISFKDGFSVLSGETGTGKSIIVEAVNLLLGGRASADLVRAGCDTAELEAFFDFDAHSKASMILENQGIDGSDGLIVRRVISSSGKSRVFINSRQSTLDFLKRVTFNLAGISSQHAHQGLLKEENHLDILDEFAGTTDLKNEVRNLYQTIIPLRRKIGELTQSLDTKKKNRIFWSFR